MQSIKLPLKIFLFSICIFSFMFSHFGCTPKPIIIKKELGYLNTPGAKEYPNAGAIMLLDSASDIIYKNGEILTKIHQIIKILNDRGKDFGEISVSYNSSFQNAVFSFARTIKSDGTIILPSKEAFNEITPYAGYNLYSDIKQKVVSMPAVEPGAIIEYEAVIKSKPLLATNGYSVDWFFEFSEPIMLSKYSITLPKKLPFKTTYYNFEQIPEIIEYKEYITYTWKKLNINEIVTEPMMPSIRKIAPWFRVTTAKSWDDIAHEFIKLIKESISPDPSLKRKVKELIADKPNAEEKIKALFYFVEKNIRYVGLEWGISSIKPHTASEIFKNAYGDCKDQSTLLITMLREAGIKAYPALLFSDNNDEIDLNTPTLSQFNHMIVYAETQERTYWLDPTVEVGNINELPSSNQNHTVWIIRDTENKAEFKKTTPKNPLDHNRTRTIKAIIFSDSSLKCDVKTDYTGDDAIQMRATLKYTEPEKYLQLFENHANTWCPSSKVTSYSFSDFNNLDSTVNTEFSFSTQNFADITSKLIIFNPNILYRLVSTNFVSQSEKRKYPVQIGRSGSSDEISEIKIPDGYEIEELPKNFEMKEDFAYYKINCYFKDGIIYMTRHSETNSIMLLPESYPRFKKFYETVAYKDNEKVVLRKIN